LGKGWKTMGFDAYCTILGARSLQSWQKPDKNLYIEAKIH